MDLRKESKIARNRLEALVDGIFAFAMTLLVTGLVMPHLSKAEAEAMLPVRIGEMHSQFISFLVAFFVLAAFWQRHNWQFHHLRRIDGGIVRITLFILACVVLLPFTTNISGDHSGVKLAVNLFHANMFGLGMLFLVQWLYMARHPDILSAALDPREVRNGLYGALLMPAVSVLACGFAFVTPSWSMATYLLMIPFGAAVRMYARNAGDAGDS